MQKKLTLSIDENLVNFAHEFSKKHKQSISNIFEEYLLFIKKQNEDSPISDDLLELYGAFENIELPNKKEMRKEFHEKNYS